MALNLIVQMKPPARWTKLPTGAVDSIANRIEWLHNCQLYRPANSPEPAVDKRRFQTQPLKKMELAQIDGVLIGNDLPSLTMQPYSGNLGVNVILRRR